MSYIFSSDQSFFQINAVKREVC